MTWSLWLDILLVLLILLFSPIGYMRGPVKELFVTLGVVFGALLVTFWAVPWGSDLNNYVDLGDDSSAFIVAMAFLVITAFVGGYGLGTALASTPFTFGGRILGGVIAALNGALLVSFTLQYVRLYLLSDENEQSLQQSYAVQFLLDQVGWLLLAAALLLIPILFYVLVTGRRAYASQAYFDDEYEYYYEDDYIYDEDDLTGYEPQTTRRRWEPAAQTRAFPPRVPGPPQEETRSPVYKAEPEQRANQPTEATRPYGSGEQPVISEPAVEPDSEQRLTASGDTDPEMAVYTPESARADQEPEDESSASQSSDEELPPGYSRCPNCRAVLPPDTPQCPVCGATTNTT